MVNLKLNTKQQILKLDNQIIKCTSCPRLVKWRKDISVTKRAAYLTEKYWAKPVPGFGDPNAKILVVGLAPGAHGANRTGRVFTGDRSGDWLYRALFDVGLSKQPESNNLNDGQKLFNTRITCAVHCAPPKNKPLPSEITNCNKWMSSEIQILWPNLKVVVALGKLAWERVIEQLLNQKDLLPETERKKLKPKPKFSHGASFKVIGSDGAVRLVLASYHPSQQNTFTGKLTRSQLQKVFEKAGRFAH